MTLRPLPLPALALTLLLLPAVPAGAQDRLAISPVTVVDVAEAVLRPHQTVIVSGDRIAAVGEAGVVEVPAGAVVIDGSGKFVIPGLWDMHVHTGNDRNAREIVYPLLVAHGV
ncbi:MAG: amidohydrolase, partial [Gemmatimonadetes bacterium]|nr:amidohydrolase [Pseudomonadales bacterium]NIW37138.1 amidohydrolase [Gemmatimonadota bacterium]NIX08116.1 amidohydrolase [Pseudomonadales bacterium]